MANIETYIPFCIQHEAVVTAKRDGETNIEYFERARSKGFVYDTGGATQTGLTLATFRRYKPRASVLQLKNIYYKDWLHCLKVFYWDKIKADQISSNSVANALMDFYWNSGTTAVKMVQSALELKDDGIVGSKTIAALNTGNSRDTWEIIQETRRAYVTRLAKNNPAKYAKYLNGWINRINELKYYG